MTSGALPTRVLLDGYWWVEGPPSNSTVQRELIRAWARRYPDDELVLVVPQAHVDLVRATGGAPDGVRVVGARLRPHGAAVIGEYGRIARRVGATVALTHNFTPRGIPAVVFLHDVLFQQHPEWFTRAERLYLGRVTAGLPRAARVVTSSAHEAARIEHLNPRASGVTPIGIAPDPELMTVEPVRPASLGNVDGFLLTVGRLNVRKNLGTAVAAALRSGAVGRRTPLVVVGERDGRDPGFGPEVQEAVESGSVVFPGYVSNAELSWLYRHATSFVFLSLDEGYGLPPVEALAFGTPVVASDIDVFRETVGGHARLVDPTDVAAAASAIRVDLESPRRVEGFVPLSWDDAADALRGVVADVVTATARGAARE
jgi:glycosyltransferase involved in cell wall biosynthesis